LLAGAATRVLHPSAFIPLIQKIPKSCLKNPHESKTKSKSPDSLTANYPRWPDLFTGTCPNVAHQCCRFREERLSNHATIRMGFRPPTTHPVNPVLKNAALAAISFHGFSRLSWTF